jgi:dihydroorotase
MRRALEYARGLGVTVAQHCEDGSLACDGAMHEGAWSSRLGIPGMPALAEEVMVARDIALSRATGARVHFLHLSTGPSIELVRKAKALGLPVTAEAAPHHFSLTDACAAGYDPVFKVNPPLRPPADVEAVKAGLADGTIDAIATDHAPHAPEFKDLPFDMAPPGMLGLETALGLAITELDLSLPRILALMSWQPAAIAGLDPGNGGGQGGPVDIGAEANLCVIDPTATWTVDPMALASRSRNSPYGGRTLTGRVRHTVFRGEPVVIDGEATR